MIADPHSHPKPEARPVTPVEVDVRIAARRYINTGYAVIPVPHRAKRPNVPGWPDLRIGLDDVDAQFPPRSNIGIILGEASGDLVDIDLDCDEAIELAPHFLPPTPVTTGRTSRPSSHYWYRSKRAKYTKLTDPVTGASVVEIRGTGHQTVVGPSVHESGEVVDMLVGDPPAVDAELLADCVASLHRAVMLKRYPADVGRTPIPAAPSTSNNTHMQACDPFVVTRASAYLASMPPAISGQGGHDRTYAAATALVHGFGLPPEVALEMLIHEYNPRCEPPWTEKELAHKVDDAVSKPHERPFGWLRDARQSTEMAALRKPDDDVTGRLLKRAQTDLGNAERLVDFAGDRLRYCGEKKQWLVWDGRRWQFDTAGAPLRIAGEMIRALHAAAVGVEDLRARHDLLVFAARSENHAKLEAAVKLASVLDPIALSAAELDREPWLLTLMNGTLNLRTGTLEPHRPGDLITKLIPIDYSESAQCPRFLAFLDRVLGSNTELIEFVQRYLGMCLTGDVSEQRMLIFMGQGANGKSVLLELVKRILSDYACDAAPTLLCADGRSEHPTEIADLWGRRLVIVSETEHGAALKLQTLKRITGDPGLKGRFMHRDFFEFTRTNKTIMVTNSLPKIKENTEAAWRRIWVVPFNVVIPEAERNPKLAEELWEEREGILAWLADGCAKWKRDGIKAPACVEAATGAYRDREHPESRFIREMLVVGLDESQSVPCSKLASTFREWCERTGESPGVEHALGHAFERLGVGAKSKRIDGVPTKVRLGVRFKTPEEVGEGGAAPGVTDVTDASGCF